MMRRAYVFKKAWKRRLAALCDGLGRALTPRLRRHRLELPNVRNLLVVRLDHLGDVVCTTPLLRALKNANPTMRLTLLTSSAGAVLTRDLPEVDDLMVFEAPWFARDGERRLSFRALAALTRTLRSRGFDAALDPRGDARHLVCLAAAAIPFRSGYGLTGGGFLLHHEVEWLADQHAVDANLRLLDAVSTEAPVDRTPRLAWQVRAEESDWVARLGLSRPLAVVHPDAGTSAKRWPPERFAHVIRFLLEQRWGVVTVGLDTDLSRRLGDVLQHTGVRDLIGQTSLQQLVTLLDAADAIVCTDSGPAHIAAALGKPCFLIWSGTSDPALWQPRGARVARVQHHVECEYCGESVCPKPRRVCMEDLRWEHVEPSLRRFVVEVAC